MEKIWRLLILIGVSVLLTSSTWAQSSSEGEPHQGIHVRTSVRLLQWSEVHSTNEMRASLGESASFSTLQAPILKVSARVDRTRGAASQFEAVVGLSLDGGPEHRFLVPVGAGTEVQTVVTVDDISAVFRIMASPERPPKPNWLSSDVPVVEAVPVVD